MKFRLICLLLIVSFSSFAPVLENPLRDDVLTHTNKLRKSRGLKELVMVSSLNEIAQQHSQDMAKGKQSFGHGGFDKRSAKAIKKLDGSSSFAENVAYGVNSGKEVVDMWKKSAGHRRNILGKYTYIGIGTAKDRRGIIYYTQVFVN
jgi:uncharacterized protein YkwD